MTVTGELARLPVIAPSLSGRGKPRRTRSRVDLRRVSFDQSRLTSRKERDRRASTRVAVRLPVEAKETAEHFNTFDLSTFGISTVGGPSYEVGTRLTLALELPDGDPAPVLLDAEVVGDHDQTGGVRLAFRKPTLEVLRRLHRFVARLNG